MAYPIKWGDEPRLDSNKGHVYKSATAALADGRFVAVWAVMRDGGGEEVHGQIFNADGSRKGAEFVLPASGPLGLASVDALPDGGFAVAWEDFATVSPLVRAQTFDVHGNATTAQILVSGTTVDWEYAPQIASRPGGGFVTAWKAYDPVQNDFNVMVRVFDAGAPTGNLPRFAAGSGSAPFYPEIEVLAGGRIVATWSDLDAAYVRIFNTDGTAAGAAVALHGVASTARLPVVTPLADGRFVAVWMHSPGEESDIHAQVFDANGDKSGPPIVVNATTADNQY